MIAHSQRAAEYVERQAEFEDAMKTLQVQTQDTIRLRMAAEAENTQAAIDAHHAAQATLRDLHTRAERLRVERDRVWRQLHGR